MEFCNGICVNIKRASILLMILEGCHTSQVGYFIPVHMP